MRCFILLLVPLAVGCGPVRTAGTQEIPAERLAILHVTTQYDVPYVQLSAIQFDGADKYAIDGNRDFYLTPGVHKVAIDLTTSLDGPLKWLSGTDMKIDGPKNLTTGDLKRGKTYELRGVAGAVQGMLSEEDMVITREMATK
jgi:hypothetical protein